MKSKGRFLMKLAVAESSPPWNNSNDRVIAYNLTEDDMRISALGRRECQLEKKVCLIPQTWQP